MNKENEKITYLPDDIRCVNYHITPRLRYAKTTTPISDIMEKEELTLQQMWQGDDGSEKWEPIEVVEE